MYEAAVEHAGTLGRGRHVTVATAFSTGEGTASQLISTTPVRPPTLARIVLYFTALLP